MPSTERCIRCGAALQRELAGVNIFPPRAGRFRKWLRSYFPMRRRYLSVRDGLAAFSFSSLLRKLSISPDMTEPTFGLILRMAIPGWAQAYCGSRLRGALFAILFWPCLLLAIVTFGSTLSAVALGLAFAIHAASVVDLLISEDVELFRRLCVIPAIAMVSVGLLYWAVGAAASQFVLPRQLVRGVSPFSAGDVVLTNQRAYRAHPPEPGDVVLFRLPTAREQYRIAGGRDARYAQFYGERIDRVLAGPGSRVLWKDNKLWVNGVESELRPLNPRQLPLTLEFSVPADHYAILLTTDALLNSQMPWGVWQAVCTVPADHIIGRTYLRNYPLSQWWWIR